jgi:hypothetical protein
MVEGSDDTAALPVSKKRNHRNRTELDKLNDGQKSMEEADKKQREKVREEQENEVCVCVCVCVCVLSVCLLFSVYFVCVCFGFLGLFFYVFVSVFSNIRRPPPYAKPRVSVQCHLSSFLVVSHSSVHNHAHAFFGVYLFGID